MTQQGIDSRPATKSQRFYLFTLTKDKSWFEAELSLSEASEAISHFKAQSQSAKVNKLVEFQTIWNEALAAGIKALEECTPTPMVVQQHEQPLNDNSPVVKQYHVPDGVCGFAWVNFSPATTPFCKWLKEHGYVGKSYYGGYDYWVGQGNQSMEKKEAFAHAMAHVINQHKELATRALPMSRMD